MLPLSPYPGLRPFNEEESIFFKGREQQVERIVKRLEEKKFLMVNGASVDGKSSLKELTMMINTNFEGSTFQTIPNILENESYGCV